VPGDVGSSRHCAAAVRQVVPRLVCGAGNEADKLQVTKSFEQYTGSQLLRIGRQALQIVLQFT